MKIFFSPSKTMKYKDIDIDFLEDKKEIFPQKREELIARLQNFSQDEIQKLFKIKGKLLEETYDNIQNYDKNKSYPSILLYEGVTFRQLDIEKYSRDDFSYLEDNLFIFSALYGILTPATKIKNYRLDMTTSIVEGGMYKFWSEEINSYLEKFSDEVFINLASKEFSKILDYKKFNIIDIEFRQEVDGKLKNISTEGKKARGMMLDYLVKNKINSIQEIIKFDVDGYRFSREDSSEKEYVFIKKIKKIDRIKFWLKLEIDGMMLELKIDNYQKPIYDLFGDEWCKVTFHLTDNKWLNCCINDDEIFHSFEVEELSEKINKLLKDKIKEETLAGGVEPDFEFILKPKFYLKNNSPMLYGEEEYVDICMD